MGFTRWQGRNRLNFPIQLFASKSRGRLLVPLRQHNC